MLGSHKGVTLRRLHLNLISDQRSFPLPIFLASPLGFLQLGVVTAVQIAAGCLVPLLNRLAVVHLRKQCTCTKRQTSAHTANTKCQLWGMMKIQSGQGGVERQQTQKRQSGKDLRRGKGHSMHLVRLICSSEWSGPHFNGASMSYTLSRIVSHPFSFSF